MLSTFFFYCYLPPRDLHSFPTRRSSDLEPQLTLIEIRLNRQGRGEGKMSLTGKVVAEADGNTLALDNYASRSEEHTSELQSRRDLVCRLLLEKKKTTDKANKRNQTLRIA